MFQHSFGTEEAGGQRYCNHVVFAEFAGHREGQADYGNLTTVDASIRATCSYDLVKISVIRLAFAMSRELRNTTWLQYL